MWPSQKMTSSFELETSKRNKIPEVTENTHLLMESHNHQELPRNMEDHGDNKNVSSSVWPSPFQSGNATATYAYVTAPYQRSRIIESSSSESDAAELLPSSLSTHDKTIRRPQNTGNRNSSPYFSSTHTQIPEDPSPGLEDLIECNLAIREVATPPTLDQPSATTTAAANSMLEARLATGFGPITANYWINNIDHPGQWWSTIVAGQRPPRVFLPEPVEQGLNPFDYVVYAQETQYFDKTLVFYVEPKSHCSLIVRFEQDQFVLSATPFYYRNITLLISKVVEDDIVDPMTMAYRRRLKYTVEINRCGIYTVRAALVKSDKPGVIVHSQQICGSPLVVRITRNYAADILRLDAMKVIIPVPPAGTSGKPPSLLSTAFARLGLTNHTRNTLPLRPCGITYCEKTDEILVTIRANHQVFRFGAKSGEFVSSFGTFKSYNRVGHLYHPAGICYDSATDRVIIADKDHHRICFFNTPGLYLSHFGSQGDSDGELSFPWGVDVGRNGELIVVADSENHRVQLFNHFGIFVTKFSAGFHSPHGVCFNKSADKIYVTDVYLQTVSVLTIQVKEPERLIPSVNLLCPQGIAVDKAGNVIICDMKSDCVRVVSPGGSLITSIHGFGKVPSSSELYHPYHDYKTSHDHPDQIEDAAEGELRGDLGAGTNDDGTTAGNFQSHRSFEKLNLPIDVCCLKNGKVAVLDHCGIIRIF